MSDNMTKIKEIRVFDESDCKYDVSELDVDKKNGVLYVYLENPDINLADELSQPYDPREIEKKIENVLTFQCFTVSKVLFYDDTGIIVLYFNGLYTTISIAEMLNIEEYCITPLDNGRAYINVDRIVNGLEYDDSL